MPQHLQEDGKESPMDAIDLRNTLEAIGRQAQHLISLPEDHRIVAYKTLDPLFLKVEAHLRGRPPGRATELLDEIKLNAIILARLDDPPADPDEVYAGRVGALVEELGAILCP
ncbi:MAG: hypothetical protein MUF52_03225 [Syntrophobacteraceae bacterium]|jgi:hypothetical protein|nr:hypothetical protein [Syntrophobacteraceae bacterium]